jgi:hypothetical protein
MLRWGTVNHRAIHDRDSRPGRFHPKLGHLGITRSDSITDRLTMQSPVRSPEPSKIFQDLR